ncbi:MAG: DUF1549 domain-containing protein, partial [Planctomycetaceae bacterium]|nr:DUF1549 domain-containing protein [Planctomycetaceae bacterium]
LIAVFAVPVCAESTLHEQIDAALSSGNPQYEKQVATPADDATFLRRITLDLTGTIPSAEKVRAFVADSSADKRVQEIDRLLASPEYARRMQYVFDTMLMERHPDKHVPAKDWRNYLRQAFLDNRHWDDLVQEMLTVDGTDEKTRPAAKFLLDRELKAEQVTRDLAQRFNSLFGETLILPESRVLDTSAKVPGIDGEKMSKSYKNVIEIFEDPKKQRKKVMSIKTDSAALEDPKDPETCAVYALYRLFASEEQQAELAQRYRAGGMGYGEAKQAVQDAALEYFGPARERREQLAADTDTLNDILAEGARKAREKGKQVLDRVQTACGLGSKHLAK